MYFVFDVAIFFSMLRIFFPMLQCIFFSMLRTFVKLLYWYALNVFFLCGTGMNKKTIEILFFMCGFGMH